MHHKYYYRSPYVFAEYEATRDWSYTTCMCVCVYVPSHDPAFGLLIPPNDVPCLPIPPPILPAPELDVQLDTPAVNPRS